MATCRPTRSTSATTSTSPATTGRPAGGDKPHRCVFAVHAMDILELSVDSSAQAAFLGFNLTFHTIARAVLRPTFQIPAS